MDQLPTSDQSLGQTAPTQSLLGGSLGLDSSAIDRNLKALGQVETSWKLPPIPDEVKLDLASQPGLNHDALSQFLYGVHADLVGNQDPAIPVTPAQPVLSVESDFGNYTPLAVDGFTKAQSMLAEMRGLKPLEVIDGDATQRWKINAINKGFMPAPSNGVVDGTWSPELNTIQKQMQYAEYNDVARGDRAGAIPLTSTKDRKGLLDVLNDWTSPSGLMRQAVKLDLWWDTGQISKEFSSWGDKWRKVGHSKNPLDFGKNLLDAVTGPIDDIVVPALNMALLFSGIGAGVNFGELALTGARVAEEASAVNAMTKMYDIPKIGSALEGTVGRVFGRATDLGSLAEKSWTATKLQGSSIGALSKAGDALAAWRALPQVTATRGLVQTGMKLGFVSQAEQRLLPSFKGHSLNDVPTVASLADKALRNPLISGPGEVLFTPYSMFDKGTFVNGAKEATGFAARTLGTTGGRAAVGAVLGAGAGALHGDSVGDVAGGAAAGAAFGASAPLLGKAGGAVADAITWKGKPIKLVSGLIGHPAAALRMTDFKPLAANQQLTAVFHDAVREHLGDRYGEFEKKLQNGSFLSAFADHFGFGGDENQAAAAMTFVALSAAIDRTASLQARAAEGSQGWWNQYFLARNKLTAQVRSFTGDVGQVDKDSVIWAIVSKEGRNKSAKRFKQYAEAFDKDPQAFADALELHNDQAMKTMRQLLSPDNLPLPGLNPLERANLGTLDEKAQWTGVDGLKGYIAKTLGSFGNWAEYHPLTNDLDGLIQAGHFEDARLAPAASIMGHPTKLNIVEALPENTAGIVPGVHSAQGPVTGSFMDEYHTPDFGETIARHMHDTMFLDDAQTIAQARAKGFYYNPMAREITPARSRFSLAKAETVTKQELLQAHDELKKTQQAFESLGKAGKLVDETGTPLMSASDFTQITTNELNQRIRLLGQQESKAAESLRRVHNLVSYMRVKGLDVSGSVENLVRGYVDSLDQDVRWAQRYGQREHMLSSDGNSVLTGIEALKARRAEIRLQANRTAAAVDHEHLLGTLAEKYGTDSQEYRDTADYLAHMTDRGYKVVYGQEFLMPHDLGVTSGLFEDINAKHLNAVTLGNFFGKRQPEELVRNIELARRASIAEQLGTTPDDDRITYAMQDLYRHVLEPERQRNAALVDDLRHQNFLQKALSAATTSGTPRSLQDLGLGINRTRVMEALQKTGWSPEEAHKIWRGLREGRYAEWKDQGLYAIEAKLRSRNQILDALHVLGGTPDASRLRQALVGGGLGAYVGANVGGAMGDGSISSRLEGAAAGGLLGAGVGIGANKLATKMDQSSWSRYGYMADWLASTRDRMRFSLSPFFDARRYSKSFMLGQIAAPTALEDGTKIALPLNQSPKTLLKRLTKEAGGDRLAAESKFKQIQNDFFNASRGKFDPSVMDEAQQQFQQIGMLGYNPTAWMTSSFHYMREAGMDTESAYNAARDMYTYGTAARSPFEQSVNFVFFPFSFEKKVAKASAHWLSDDLTRAVLLHDAYKAYELLNQHYDLNKWSDEHLPVLSRLAQLNAFEMGLSPGKLGGVNAPFVNAALGTNPLSKDRDGLIFNLFNPQGVNMGPDGTSVEQLTKLGKQLVPAINDLQYMLHDLKEQGHVLFDPAHATRAAQAKEGFTQWSEFKKGVDAALKQSGASYYDLHHNPGLTPLLDEYNKKKQELESKYPGWVDAKLKGQGNLAELDQERQHRINTVQYHPEEASPTDVQFSQMETLLEQKKKVLKQYGITDWQDMAPADFAQIRGVGLEMMKQNPGFEMIWKKFYQRDFGLLETVVR